MTGDGEGGTSPAGDRAGFGAADLAVGSEFADYVIEAEIGRGGMGVVYRVRHLALDRVLALKLIVPAVSAEPRFRERFRRESRVAASIEHPNVIPVYHAGEERGMLYLAMRFVTGSDLGDLVARSGRLDLGRTAWIVAGVAAGLDAAHARGLVHRDVKPANVLLEGEGPSARIFVCDFGISRSSGGSATITSTGEILGSLDYVAPEQIEGVAVDHRADVYSLGGVLHHMLTGEPPYPRESGLAKLFAHANAPPPKPSEVVPGLPPELDEVVARAMAKDPDDRYFSARALSDDVARLAATTSPLPVAPPAPSGAAQAREATTDRVGPRARWIVAGAVGLVALAAAAIAIALTAGGSGDGGGGGGGDGGGGGFSPEPVATVGVSEGAQALTVGPVEVWVSAQFANKLDAIDPDHAAGVSRTVQLPSEPHSVAVGFGSVWAALEHDNQVARIQPSDNEIIRIPVGVHPSDLVVRDRYIWVSNEDSDTLSRIDPLTNKVDRTVAVGDGPHAIASGEGSVWSANLNGGTVSRVDPAAAVLLGGPIRIGGGVSDVAVGEGGVWVTDRDHGTLTGINPRSGHTGDPIEVGPEPRGVAVGFRHLWVVNGGGNTVSVVDPRTQRIVGDPIPVGHNPTDVAVGAGSVWTANFGDATVTRINPGVD
jgi:YVTN family beta-propeller protein